ncbi:MAG: PaaI family thioesterase [Xanthomonadales bacterium]|nr:PaaI family thioesterase [Xanthomonadales bacterium]
MSGDSKAKADFSTIEGIQASIDSSPFNAFCRLKVKQVDPAGKKMVMHMPAQMDMERLANSGQWHGGPIACLIDTAGCYASMMVLGHGVPTINFQVDYLRPAIDTDLVAVATVRKAGRSVTVADVDVLDVNGKLVAIGRCTYGSASG